MAAYLKKQGQKPLLVAADVKRPAAVQQLVTLGKQLDIPVYEESTAKRGVEVCVNSLKRARDLAANWVILDTAGRLHIDEEMMGELAEIKDKVKPQEALLVVDAMTGQDAVRAAEQFHQRVALSGLVLTKIDGDARGGAALSITAVTGLPIKFLGTGEKLDAFESYHPDRLASRIMGMGDMATLIERAQEVIDPDQAKAMEKKIRAADFSLDDLLEQLRQVKKMGSIGQVLDMVPGMKFLSKRLPNQEVGDRQLTRTEAVILSMTPHERKHPEVIGSSRRRRIAAGSGTTTADVNRLLEQYQQMKKLLKQFSGKGGKPPRLPSVPGRFR